MASKSLITLARQNDRWRRRGPLMRNRPPTTAGRDAAPPLYLDTEGEILRDLFEHDALIGVSSLAPFTVHADSATRVHNLTLRNQSRLRIQSGARVYGYLFARDHSQAALFGGKIHGDLFAVNAASVTLCGATIHGDVNALDNSRLVLSAGTIAGNLYVYDDAQIHLFGADLQATLLNRSENGATVYALSGFLSGGASLHGKRLYVENGGGAAFTLIADAAPFALAASK